MKKTILLLLLLVAVAFAAAPANDVVDGAYQWDMIKNISASDNFDSLKTAADSSVLLTKYIPKQGYECMLVCSPFTGTSADSADIDFMVDCYDNNDSLLYRVNVGSITDDTDGAAILMPFGGTLIGSKFTIKAVATNGGTVLNVQLNVMKLYGRRVAVINRRL